MQLPEFAQAVVFFEPNRAEVREVSFRLGNSDIPQLTSDCTVILPSNDQNTLHPDYVLVNVLGSGICGTDIHLFTGKRFGNEIAKAEQPLIAGHEFYGRVSHAGEKFRHLLGEEVLVNGIIDCFTENRCTYCQQGQFYQHNPFRQLGIAGGVPGGFMEYTAALGKNCVLVPKDSSSKQKACVELLACLVHALHDKLETSSTHDDFIIFGAGPAGLLSLQLIKRLNPENRVWLIEPIALKRERAEALGASGAYSPEGLKDLLASQGWNGAQYVIETSGAEAALSLVPLLARPLAKVLLFGLGFKSVPSGFVDSLIEKELQCVGSLGPSGYNTFERALGLLPDLDVNSVVSHSYSGLCSLPAALLESRTSSESYIKGMLTY